MFKSKITIKKSMKIKRGKTEEAEFKEKNLPENNEEEDFLGELDLDED